MISIEIDEKKISTDEGASIIEAADAAGIYIPRFCYHKKLSVAANCRMCLVEVDKVGKPLPACATPVTSNMKVFTRSKKALDAQKAVMEYLLINHPLDCPICDQGGQCELQDLSMGYGSAVSKYNQKKRAVFDEDIGPLIETQMTRCIHCTRCVRFGEEIAGLRELGVTSRGEDSKIGTYVKKVVRSELSGNVIDLCPVGALTSKPARYAYRGWEALEHPMIAPHDCVGSNLFVHTKGREYSSERLVMRVVPRENEAINETWISDRDRFSYEGLNHQDRCLFPMMKQQGKWVQTDWDSAIQQVAASTRALVQKFGPEQIAALVSPSATLEECYLFQAWVRALGSNNIDYRLRETDFTDQETMPLYPSQGLPTAEIEKLDTLLLIGSNVRVEQPMIAHRIKKAALNGAKIFVINPCDYEFHFTCQQKMISADLLSVLAELSVACGVTEEALAAVQPSSEVSQMANAITSGKNTAVFLGAGACNHRVAAALRYLARKLAEQIKATYGVLTEGANAAGAYIAGAVPHRSVAGMKVSGTEGANAKQVLLETPVRGYFLLGFEAEHDTSFPYLAVQSLKSADWVVCMASFVTDVMKTYADVILPIAPFVENEGTLINAEGTWQTFEAVGPPKEETQPAWKVLRALGRAMAMPALDYRSLEAVRNTIKQAIQHSEFLHPLEAKLSTLPYQENKLQRIGDYLLYTVDPIVRRATALQEMTQQHHTACIAVNENEAAKHCLQQGDCVTARQNEVNLTLPLVIDNRLADGIVFIPSGLPETAGYGPIMGSIELFREVS